MRGVASWLFAPPHTTRADSEADVRLGQRTTQRARGEDVDVGAEQLVRGSDADVRMLRTRTASTADRRHVGGEDGRPVGDEMADQPPPDLADSADRDPPPSQRRFARTALRRGGAHALEDAEGGEHAAVPGTAVLRRASGDPVVSWWALAGDDVHVGDVGADVAGGDVAATERGEEAAVGAQQRLGLVRRRVPDDDGLAAAVVQPGAGVLVGHRPGEAQHVVEGGVLVRVLAEARPAERRPEGGRVDGDDRPQPGRRVVAEWTTCSCAGPAQTRAARLHGRRRPSHSSVRRPGHRSTDELMIHDAPTCPEVAPSAGGPRPRKSRRLPAGLRAAGRLPGRAARVLLASCARSRAP